MSWTYAPAAPGPRIIHPAGTVPARPLDVGDTVVYASGFTSTISAVTDTRSMVVYTERPGHPVFLAPVSGDYSECIGAVQ